MFFRIKQNVGWNLPQSISEQKSYSLLQIKQMQTPIFISLFMFNSFLPGFWYKQFRFFEMNFRCWKYCTFSTRKFLGTVSYPVLFRLLLEYYCQVLLKICPSMSEAVMVRAHLNRLLFLCLVGSRGLKIWLQRYSLLGNQETTSKYTKLLIWAVRPFETDCLHTKIYSFSHISDVLSTV